MQNCNGFAEAALRPYLIMPTHHPQRSKTNGTSKYIHSTYCSPRRRQLRLRTHSSRNLPSDGQQGRVLVLDELVSEDMGIRQFYESVVRP